jgi:hypothetical protein
MLGRLYWNYQRSKRNSERQELAASQGWQFAPGDPALLGRWRSEPFVKPGDRRETAGVVRGETRGVPFTAFDFRVRTRVVTTNFIFRTSEYDTLTVWALHLPAALPSVQCKGGPKLRRKLLDRLDGQAAVRTGDDDFDGRFGVYSDSPDFARTLLTPQLRAWLREHKLTGWWIDGSDLLLTQEAVSRVKPDKLAAVADDLADMVAHFPATIWPQHGEIRH